MLVKMPEKTTCIPARKRASAQTAFAIWKSGPNPVAAQSPGNYRFVGATAEFTATEEAVTGGA
jgi:hypothetical protein